MIIDELIDGTDGHIMSLSCDCTHMVVGASEAGIYNRGHIKAYELAVDETTSPVAGCVDSANKIGFKIPKGRCRNCKFVGSKMSRCKEAKVAAMCPLICGKWFENACKDSPLKWWIGKEAPRSFSCSWVARNPMMCRSRVNASICRKTCHTSMYETLCMEKDERSLLAARVSWAM